MKNVKYSLLLIISGVFIASCNNGKSTDNSVVWAGEVESKTMVIKPEGFQDEYWMSVNKNVDYDKIFYTVVEAVLKGQKKAYDIISDKELTNAEVKSLLEGDEEEGKVTSKDLSAIRTRESWYFNEDNFTFEKKVKRIDLLLKKLDPTTGEYLGDKALFYIKLDE